MDISLRIDRARYWAMSCQDAVFYSQLMMQLDDVIDDTQPTACTDGKRIRWNPKFVEGLTDPELRYLLLHETLHPARGHLWRLPFQDPMLHSKANVAADHEINLDLNETDMAKRGEISFIAGGCADKKWKNMSAEEIFAQLPDEPPSHGIGDFSLPTDKDGNPLTKDQLKQIAEKWERAVIMAAQAAKASGQGRIPADMERILEKVMAKPLNWKAEMAEFARNAMSVRNDWTRSPRRQAWQEVIYPRHRRDNIGLVVFVRDTSGSVSDAQAAEFTALIDQSRAETGCKAIVIDCDAKVNAVYDLQDEACPLKANGGGGTDFRPAFKKAMEISEESEKPIAGLVYITDMAGTFPDEHPEFPVLWVSVSEETDAPFGRVVKYS